MHTPNQSLVSLVARYRSSSAGPRLARRGGIPPEDLPDAAGLASSIDYWDRVIAVAVAHRRLLALVVALGEDIPARAAEFLVAALRDYPDEPDLQQLARERGLTSTQVTSPDGGQLVDLAIITVIREEYEAVKGLLDKEGATMHWHGGAVNLHAWTMGHVKQAKDDRSYKVVLAMTGQAGNLNSKDAVRETIERFKPRYVLVVGIAGGLGRDGVRKGSLTISDLINGYEPGKLEALNQQGHDFHPRLTQIFPVDNPLRTAALALAFTAPDWHRAVDLAPPDPAVTNTPNVISGPIASGEKVIDDSSRPFFLAVMQQFPKIIAVEMEGAGAASAIQQLREKQTEPCGFLMLRGISDMPRTTAAPENGDKDVGETQRQERDSWKSYAATVAAAFAINMIRHTWPVPPR